MGSGTHAGQHDRFTVWVVVVGGDRHRHTGTTARGNRIVDRDGRIVDAIVVGLSIRLSERLFRTHRGRRIAPATRLEYLAGFTQQWGGAVVLADHIDPPRVHRPHQPAIGLIDPHQIDRGRDIELTPSGNAGDNIVEQGPLAPVETHDLRGHAPNQGGDITGDSQQIRTIDTQAVDGDLVFDTVATDTPELVVAPNPAARCGRAWLL